MLITLILAVLVGLALSVFGGGGSLLSVAILSLAAGMPASAAVAASLFVIGVASTAALLARSSSGFVATPAGLAFASTSMIGAFAGGRLAAHVPEAALLAAFGATTLITSVAMLTFRPILPEIDLQRARPAPLVRDLRLLAVALGVGVVMGMLGAGGGFLIVPTLVLYGRVPMQRAVTTSLVVIALSALAGFLGHLGHTSLDWRIVLPFTLLATLGSLAGGALARRASQELLRRGFAALVLLAALLVVARALPPSH